MSTKQKQKKPRNQFAELFEKQRMMAEQGNAPDLSLKEINEEIRLARKKLGKKQ